MNKLVQPGALPPGIGRTVVVCGLAVAMAVPAASAQQAPAPAPGSPRKTHRAAKLKPAVPESIPEVTLPAPPPPERLVPEQMPPDVPQVSWDGSQLTIKADNSTLADILVAIRARTGAEIDVPANASRERIAARLGPGPARDVISTLLSWTDYDYIIQASDSDPLGIQSVLLTPRGKSDTVVASAAVNAYGGSQGRAIRKLMQGATSRAETSTQGNSSDAESSTEVPVASTQPAAAEPQPTAAAVPPPDVPPAQAEVQPTAPTVAGLNAASATLQSDPSQLSGSPTEQRMQMLQNLYQQRKQMTEDARKNPPTN